MRIGGLVLMAALLLAVVTVGLTAARECDMQPHSGGVVVRVRATGEDITANAGPYARACLRRILRGEHRDGPQVQRARSLPQL